MHVSSLVEYEWFVMVAACRMRTFSWVSTGRCNSKIHVVGEGV